MQNETEPSHAIKSMFAGSMRRECLMSIRGMRPAAHAPLVRPTWSTDDWRKSAWFTHAWTLQELLAARSVKFFNLEARLLGDKQFFEGPLHEATGIAKSALRGAPLVGFTIEERLSWATTWKARLEEVKAYSLLGMFDVEIAPLYDPGTGRAFDRLMSKIRRREQCIRDLGSTDPRHDKTRIKAAMGDLLDDRYRWILRNADFQQWRGSQQSQLLWIRGYPGKGKTMLLCGISDELKMSIANRDALPYFFCQAGVSHVNNASAVLKGLIHLLVAQIHSLASHLQAEYDRSGWRKYL